MIVIFYGTGAELIKMYGIVKGVPRDQQYLLCTSQQYAGLQRVHKQLDIEPDLYLTRGHKGEDVASMKQMAGLMLRAHGAYLKQLKTIRDHIKNSDKKHGTKSVVLVHGDTLTTVVGAYLGKLLKLPVGHVEAGLRSGSWKSPFPEELDRRIVAKIARLHFTPSQLAEKNLRDENTKGEIINTTYNTAKDAIEQSDTFVSENYTALKLPEKYCLVLLHRTELIESKSDFEDILRVIREYADKKQHVVFTLHTTTKEKLTAHGLSHLLEHEYIRTIPKQPYFDFMAIVKNAECIITDGGGLQEDAFFLGIPTVVHRKRTEREDGLGHNATLSKMDLEVVRTFLQTHVKKEDLQKVSSEISPSKVVIEYLQDKKYIKS
jgi:UDP-N-acetylglucosamine 2-epimerase (non-hydrolysing)